LLNIDTDRSIGNWETPLKIALPTARKGTPAENMVSLDAVTSAGTFLE
jgi:hypothetical protein